MQYLKYTHVYYRARRSVADFPVKNGPDFPSIEGLTFSFAEESKYPAPVPTFYGTIDTTTNPEYDHQGDPVWVFFLSYPKKNSTRQKMKI